MSAAVGNTLPQPGQHVVVGMSGGVDSSVTAHLLKQQGCQVTGLFMVNWTEDEEGYCSAAEDFQDARRVAEQLDIPLLRVDFAADYRARVFQQFLDDYRAGKTPNPDVLCNREVKFQPFREYALRLGADGIATGHYARIEHADDGPHLMRSVTEDKDQTYFLSAVRPEQLRKVYFPLGGTTNPRSGRWRVTSGWTCTARRTPPASALSVNAPSANFWRGISLTRRAKSSTPPAP